jgi:hypothetical protein
MAVVGPAAGWGGEGNTGGSVCSRCRCRAVENPSGKLIGEPKRSSLELLPPMEATTERERERERESAGNEARSLSADQRQAGSVVSR